MSDQNLYHLPPTNSMSISSIFGAQSWDHGDPHSRRTDFQRCFDDLYRNNAQAYDRSILRQLDRRSGSWSTTLPLKSLRSTPPIIPSKLDAVNSVSRWPETLVTMDPASPYPGPGAREFNLRSASYAGDLDKSRSCSCGSCSGNVACGRDGMANFGGRSEVGSDERISLDQDTNVHMIEMRLRHLQITEYLGRLDPYSPPVTAGQQRHAASPPLDIKASIGDVYKRQEPVSQTSQVPQFQLLPESIYLSTTDPMSSPCVSVLPDGGSREISMKRHGYLSPGYIVAIQSDDGKSPSFEALPPNSRRRGSTLRMNHDHSLHTKSFMISDIYSDTFIHSKEGSDPDIQEVIINEYYSRRLEKFDSRVEFK
jgi:hypothetical protein